MSLAPSAAHADGCSTANPAADVTPFPQDLATVQGIQNSFAAGRMAEGCATPMVLPGNYLTMTFQQQFLTLYNLEREARGLGDLQLDTTLLGEIALNHTQEIVTYGYADHQSPINQPQDVFSRFTVNPVFNGNALGENGFWSGGTPTCFTVDPNTGAQTTIPCDPSLQVPAANVVFTYMYEDGEQQWGHRMAILGNFNWVGLGVTGAPGTYQVTSDFAMMPATYAPPAAADTNPPVVGQVSYDGNGNATATGVVDSPANVNDTAVPPLTAAITGVVFYTNAIVETGYGGTFNTVAATQTAPGTWTAQITVNPGDVLHAVAVDGSGNFTDVTVAPPPTTLNAGTNTLALPAGTTGLTMARLASAARGARVPAATPTAAALTRSIDRQAHRSVVQCVKVYQDGRWRIYLPGKSASFPLYTSEGVVVILAAKTKWRAPVGDEPLAAPTIAIRKGWNFVAAPYPITHMTCHATRLELAKLGVKMLAMTLGPAPNRGVLLRPNKHGGWGNDKAILPDSKGFWVEASGSTTWTPSPTQYHGNRAAIS